MVSTQTILASAGIAGAAAILGYCIYFDRKRRLDPNYKKKILERRAKNKEKSKKSNRAAPEIPIFMNPQEAQAFFLQEVQLGEELLSEGDVEGGVDHLCSAVQLCGAPSHLIDILKQTLPPQAFALLKQRLATTKPIVNMPMPSMNDAGPTVTLMEDDLE